MIKVNEFKYIFNNKIEKYALWSTLKFQRRSSLHIKGIDFNRATKGMQRLPQT
jgi:hypothetical protein